MAARILVADDDATLQRLLFHTLKLEGYEVIAAHDGIEVIDAINRDRPDLVILDVMMPGHNGFEICQMVRERPETVTLPIIMLSGLSDIQEKVNGLRVGADEYVTKPIDLRELMARVDALLKRNRLLRQSAVARVGRVLTLVGAKGGVGTTTLALNFAALLAKAGKSVIAAEIRPDFGTFSAQLRTPSPEKNLSGILAFDPAAISEPLVASHLSNTSFGVRVLFGPQKVDQFVELDPVRVGATVGRLVSMADYVIIDLPSIASAAHETVIKNSGFIVLVMEPEITSTAAASVKLRQLENWGASGSMLRIMVVNRQSTMLLSLREIENRLGHTVDAVMPPAIEALGIAIQYGTPLALYQPEHVATVNLGDFISRVTEKPSTLPRR